MDLSGVLSQKGIGEGGNWRVYRCLLQNGLTMIVKEPKNWPQRSIQCNLERYNLVKDLGLPTTSFLEKSHYNKKDVLVTEDLKKNGISFVSPNSVWTEDDKKRSSITRLFLHQTSSERFESEEEQYFYEHRSQSVPNFPNFLKRVTEDINKATENNIQISFDSYFFSIEKDNPNSRIDYKIADWDNIEKCEDKNFQVLLKSNMEDFQQAMSDFLNSFVQEGKNRNSYLLLTSKMSS